MHTVITPCFWPVRYRSVALHHMATGAWPLPLFLMCCPTEGVLSAPLACAVLLSLAYESCTGLQPCCLLNAMKGNLWYWSQPCLQGSAPHSCTTQLPQTVHFREVCCRTACLGRLAPTALSGDSALLHPGDLHRKPASTGDGSGEWFG